MNVVGLIVEYNPLHNGHAYHFRQALQATGAEASVAVMSGNFLQRGEPAIVHKWARAEMALAMGIDLVIELPAAFCTQNAEVFAFGAVSALDSLGLVDALCFGSESGDISWIHTLADRLVREPGSFKQQLKQLLALGLPYPKAYAQAASLESGVPEPLLSQPNNILGLHYVLALKRLQSTIQPVTITRIKAGYHQEHVSDRQIASATALRKLILDYSLEHIQPYVPVATYQILKREKEKGLFPIRWESFYRFLMHSLFSRSATELAEIHEMEEGLQYRLKKIIADCSSFAELMEKLKTKRYTWNRLQRLLLYVLLNLRKQEMESFSGYRGVPYLRVLGFSEKGRQLLHAAKKRARVPLVSRIPRDPHEMLRLDIRAASIYALGCSPAASREVWRSEYVNAPIQFRCDS